MDKFVGLGLLGFVAALLAVAWRVATTPIRLLLMTVAVVGWVVAAFSFVGLLAIESLDTGQTSMSCPVPGADSTSYPSHWSWIPPGEVCEAPSGDVGPTYLRIPAAIALIAIPTISIRAWLGRPVKGDDKDELVGSST